VIEREAAGGAAGGRAAAPGRAGTAERTAARASTLGGRSGRLEAPHRRLEGGSRRLEKTTVSGYKGTAWLLAHLPPRPAWTVIGWFSKAGYLLWPKKRRWVDANFGHVLGRSPSDRAVRRLALRAYGHYARYLVELMRLPSLPADVRANLVEPEGIGRLEDAWRDSNGVILAVGHVGNNEACAAGVAWRGWPISVVADDSSFPEMFELLRQQRESWGVAVIPWRNLRAVYAVLRRKEMLALLIDWGYRSDGLPVRLFDAWTTLPAGPATLAAKTGAKIVPVTIRRERNGRFSVNLDEPILVASAAPADLQRATQAMADALQRTIAGAPDQWYSFKPMWPASVEEQAELAARAERMQAQTGVVPWPAEQLRATDPV
jgi:phosphatidylinositol dimannoside acyltransferase